MIDPAPSLVALPSPPRAAHLHTRFRVLRWLLVLAAILPPGCAIGLGSYENARIAELARDGRMTSGTVAEKLMRQARSTEYVLESAFEVDGRSYRATQTVSRERYLATPIGAAVEITFLPRDPSHAVLGRVDDARVAGQRSATFAAAVALFLAFGIVVAIYERYLRRALHLLRHGQAVTATLEAGRGVRFRYRAEDGIERSARSGFRGAPPPELEVGAEAIALCDPARPARCALLASLEQLGSIDGSAAAPSRP
ncbi:MAG: hypothetical protein IPN34_26525 [Planctomycetes bacterium]|nr:hypothetical protein [Planctomycetota bacterium]